MKYSIIDVVIITKNTQTHTLQLSNNGKNVPNTLGNEGIIDYIPKVTK